MDGLVFGGQVTGSAIYSKFPDTAEEFQKAGRCFAYGENTACVFHLMRVVDFYLREVARSLNISYDARNWHGIGTTITEITAVRLKQDVPTASDGPVMS